MSQTLGGQLTTDALAMAISRRGVPELVHSDRGSTYATAIYLHIIRKHGIRQSMSRKGNCWDTQSTMASNVRSNLTRAGIGEAAFALTCRLGAGVPRASPGQASVT